MPVKCHPFPGNAVSHFGGALHTVTGWLVSGLFPGGC
jgi:hypothetical protein